MKKIFLLISILGLLLVSCERDKEVNIRSLEVLWEILAPSYNSIDVEVALAFSGTYESYYFREAYVQYATSQDFTDYQSVEMQWSWDNSFKVCIEDLTPNTTYYARYHVKTYSSSATTQEISEFKTLAASVPIVITSAVTQIMNTSAVVGGNVIDDGGMTITERGVVYSTSSNPTTSNSKVTSGSVTGSYTCSLTNLQEGTTYYVRAYVVSGKVTAYGEEKSFTTKVYTQPTVTTSSATNISNTFATIGGNVTDDGGLSVTERGVVYSTSQNPTTSNSKVTSGSGTGSYTCSLTNLQEGTTYYVRAYVVSGKVTAYGEEKSFTTKVYTQPTVTTFSATNISNTSAIIGGNVTDDGGLSVTERGVVYSTKQNPVITNLSNTIRPCGSGVGEFTYTITGLQPNTTYYVRAYAINEKGTAYGEQVSFTTSDDGENGHDYVDLGLSVKWATCNVGASKPEEYGDYFAWGEVEPKDTYSWSTYKWCNGSYNTLTKYCTNSSYGTVDNKKQLDLSDDAARANWGGSWRMPTQAEQDELYANCTWTWTSQNGVNGYKVTSKKSGYTNKSIFLPAAGYYDASSLKNAGSRGDYWSSSLYTGSPYYACRVYFFSGSANRSSGSTRYCGQPVRPVCP